MQYMVTGSATAVDLTYFDDRGQSHATSTAVPLSPPITLVTAAGSYLYVSAQNTGTSGVLTCRILVDGEVVAQETTSSRYAISCSATA
ncbi:MmpS family transport accessory protein [Streptomyces sp. NPDC013953]|uniref:MmpS family transport accessory protein n=1 Tax=Streptomyces sp. NPDC013953 TaxID=3364868 RepID=UPI0036FE9A73